MNRPPEAPPTDLSAAPAAQVDGLADQLFRRCLPTGSAQPTAEAWRQWLDSVQAAVVEFGGTSIRLHCGGHQLLERIGEGAFGVVYRARRPAPADGSVAIKVLKGHLVGSEAVSLFQREVALASRLDDPRTVRVLGSGMADGRPYLVSELVEHALPITVYCDRHRLGLRARLALLAEVVRGVAHAHRCAVLHRDLKPSNILVQSEPGAPAARVRVVDFGLARAITAGSAGNSLWSLDGWLLGTPAYMAPEQARGRRDLDVRVDVYALGVVMFELLTGSLPWHDTELLRADAATQLRAVDNGPLPLPGHRLAQLPAASERPWSVVDLRGELDWIVARAMASDAAERYPEAAAFAEDLERFLEGRPVAAAPRGGTYALRCWARRNRTAASGLASAAVLLIVAFLISSVLAWSAAGDRADRVAAQGAAEATLRRFDLLAEDVRLRRAELLAETLYPAGPARVPALRAWLADYGEPIRSGRAALAAAVAKERALVEGGDRAALPDLLREGERLLAAVDRCIGTGACVRVAAHLAQWSSPPVVADARWRHVAAGLAADPRFVGVQLSPQPDLVPLGADPTSGLQEFAHWLSGDVPRRGPDGRLEIPATA
ncbi:MAG: serine/threonine protein kinase, partial [Planctomycetes bacterium]|nr:serine/threonine protein kinase [Planctomycetota bacterium]